MRILVAAASFSSKLSGIQRHAFNVVRCLLTHPAISEVQLVIAPWQREMVRSVGLGPGACLTIHVAEMGSGSLSRNRWYYRELPVLAQTLAADLVHLTYPVPVDSDAFSCPILLTLHDLYPYEVPSNFGLPKVLFNRFILQRCLRSATSIACVSDITRLRLEKYVPRHVQQKALRIYNCVEQEPYSVLEGRFAGWQGRPFLLCVAQHRRNKNIPFLLHVFDRMILTRQISSSTRLLIVGIEGPETRLIRRTIAHLGLAHHVLLMQGLSEQELRWCYRNCKAVLAPSTTEGFGLPVVEALLAGAPVVCSDIPAFRELGGEHCRYVPLDNQAEAQFANAILDAMRDEPKEPLAMPLLSAKVIAGEYVRLYSRLLDSATAARNGAASVAHTRLEGQSL
jgi:glycosyltransferase involved in cell wall biosynthesis